MTNTVKQIVDEYLNRQKNEYESITFETPSGFEAHSEISNLYQDGTKMTELKLDTEFHVYQLDRKMGLGGILDIPDYSLRVTFIGKIIRFCQKIEE